MKRLLFWFFIFCLFFPSRIFAQCSTGEAEVTIIVHTDNWGSEVTWSLKAKSGTPVYSSGGPYADGAERHDEQKVCVPEGEELIFTINDSYGDGICAGEGDGYYSVSVYDFIYAQGCSYNESESTSFIAEPAPNNNAQFEILNINEYAILGDNSLKGSFSNQGVNTITSIDVNWSVEDGSVNTFNITGIDVPTYEEYKFTHNLAWTTSTANETKKLKVWLSNTNGIADEKPENDTIVRDAVYILKEAIQRRVLIEHYTNAGCGPCATQNPVLEALSNTGDNHQKIAHVAYHTAGPGYDPMYDFNELNNQGSARASYYGITGVPTAVLSGNQFSGSPASITQNMLDMELEKYGLFKITPEITLRNDSLFIDVSLVSLKSFTTGSLKAFVILIEDMEYSSPPGTNGERIFPDVMRYMLTGVNGEDLGFPLADDNINISSKLKLSDQLGASLQLIVFVQDVDTKEVLMAYQFEEDLNISTTGFDSFDSENMVALSKVKLFPNPVNNFANISLNILGENNIKVKVFDTFGRLLKVRDYGKFESGEHMLNLDLSMFDSGVYLVNVNIGDESLTKKIQLIK